MLRVCTFLVLFLGPKVYHHHGKFMRFCTVHTDSLFPENYNHARPCRLCTGSLEYVLRQGPYMGNEVPIFLPGTDWPKGEPLTPNGPIRDFPGNLALGLEGSVSEGCL